MPDLVQALLGSEDFAVEAGPGSAVRQCKHRNSLQVNTLIKSRAPITFSDARFRQLAELSELFREKPDTAIRMLDSERTGSCVRVEYASVADAKVGKLCLAADVLRGSHTLICSSAWQPRSLNRCGEPRLEAAELSAVRFVPADACRGRLWLRAESCESSAHFFSCRGGCRTALLAILRRWWLLLRPAAGRETGTAACMRCCRSLCI